MLRSTSVLCAGLALAVLGGSIAVGCSSSTDEPTSQLGAVPPPRPTDAPEGDGNGYVFAVDRLFLGETDRQGTTSINAWKKFGYNLDGLDSDGESTDVCKTIANAPPSSVHPDGDGGIDNAFGKQLIPTIQTFAMNPSTSVNESLAEGDFTLMVRIDKMGTGAAYNNLPAALYGGANLGSIPKWDGTDTWPVVPELLQDPTNIDSSQVQFSTSYLTDNTWVSGSPGTINLTISVSGFALDLQITNAVITMDVNAGRTGVTEGIIAGVLEVEPFIDELRAVAGSFNTELCGGSTFESIADQIRQAADIMADGTQDPNSTCNAISIGLGFEAKPVILGDIADATPPSPDPCAGGMGGMGGMGMGGAGGMGMGGAGGAGGAGGGN